MSLLDQDVEPTRPQPTAVPFADPPAPAAVHGLWPGREIQVDDDLTLHVRETPGPGPGASRTVYVHGLGGSATNWTDLAGQLAGSTNGIAVDLPGFGRSKPPADCDFSIPTQAERVSKLITALGDGPVHLIGNSMGGAISLLLAANHPELVRTLTLISPAMPDLRPDVRRMADPRFALAYLPVVGRRARAALARMTPEERTEQMLRLCFAEPDHVTEDHIKLAVAEYAERSGMPWAGWALGQATLGLFRSWLLPAQRSLWAVAKRVATPTLVIWGDQDRLVSVRKAPRTTRSLQRGRLLVLSRTGHVAQMERPVTVAKAVLGLWTAAERDEW